MSEKKPKGKLLVIGGNEHSTLDGRDYIQRKNPEFVPEEILKRFTEELKDNCNSRIGIITTSSGEPMRTAESFRDVFHALNCHRTDILDIQSKEEANNARNLELLERMDGVIFTGGDQTRIRKILFQTGFSKILHRKYQDEDFIIAGTSSGAMALADYMICRGSAEEGFIKGEVEIIEGLGLIKNVVIDSHFDSRGRFGRLVQAATRKKALGIGVGDDTAILIIGEEVAHVVGSGVVTIIETDKLARTNINEIQKGVPFTVEGLVVHILSRENAYELKKEKMIPEESISEGNF